MVALASTIQSLFRQSRRRRRTASRRVSPFHRDRRPAWPSISDRDQWSTSTSRRALVSLTSILAICSTIVQLTTQSVIAVPLPTRSLHVLAERRHLHSLHNNHFLGRWKLDLCRNRLIQVIRKQRR